jgi:phosphoglycolate phosphatase
MTQDIKCVATNPQNAWVNAKAIIFDLDGTLLDTIEDITDAMNAVLRLRGYPTRSVEECKYLVGEGTEMFARGALPLEARDPETVGRMVVAYRAEYATNCARKTKPYPGIVGLLDGLTACEIPMAILSNKRDPVVKQEVSHFLPKASFAEIRGARPAVPLKPDPTAALLLARMLGTAPHTVVFVGDTKTDMQTAVSAGMVAVGALWGFRAADELRSNGAQYLIRRPTDIPSLLRMAQRA